MELLYSLIDDQYPDNGYNHTRPIVRAIIYNSQREIALIHILCDDIFGHRDYLETPGGGVENNEDLITALKRELREEVGAEITDIEEIGEVIDFYNLLNRKNDQFYFLCKLEKLHERHITNYEKKLLFEVKWIPIDTAIKMVEETKRTKIATLVINRELPILKIAKEMLDRKAL